MAAAISLICSLRPSFSESTAMIMNSKKLSRASRWSWASSTPGSLMITAESAIQATRSSALSQGTSSVM